MRRALLVIPLALGCAAVKPPGGAGGRDAAAGTNGDGAPIPTDAAGPDFVGLFDTQQELYVLPDGSRPERPPPTPGKVYAHSADTLYLLEPISKQVTVVGTFDCIPPGSLVDLAIDRAGKMTGSAAISFNGALGGALLTIDAANAHCVILNRGPDLATSLTYVPLGTLLPDQEALVGYADDRYVRVDPTTGAITDIGPLNTGGGTHWFSSGDIVSITGGGTYLTVVPQSGPIAGGDRIVEVDPKTGALIRVIGPTGSPDVLGLGYWGGIAYGFTIAGKLIQIDLATGAGTDIPIPAAPPDLNFLGAGTTTIAPIFID
jgi:hypothetical protein